MRKSNANLSESRIDPSVKDVLLLLGAGTFLTASIILPGLPIILKPISYMKQEKDKKEWEKFNIWRLRQVMKRLHEQKAIEITDGLVKITDKGRRKVLKFTLEEMELKKKIDGKWRLILYDIHELKKEQRELFRFMLKKLKLLQIQKSVYLTPFVCDDEIEYLRQVFNIDEEVIVMKIANIENEAEYKKYFGI